MKICTVFFLLLLSSNLSAQAFSLSHIADRYIQDESDYCPEIRSLETDGYIAGWFYVTGFGQDLNLNAVATSFLLSEGSPPVISEELVQNGFDTLVKFTENDENTVYQKGDPTFDYLVEYINWTAMYAPGNIVDGDTTTAWCEGVDGNGIGEIILIPIEFWQGNGALKNKYEIFSGFGLNENFHKKNARPKDITIYILDTVKLDATQSSFVSIDLKMISSISWQLEDYYGWQNLPLPILGNGNYETTSLWIAIRIDSVYQGTLYEDTLISEIRVKE